MLLLTHSACLRHDTGPGHPEHSARLEAVLDAVEAAGFSGIRTEEARPATRQELTRAHSPEHVNRVLGAVPPAGRASLDADTIMSSHSGDAGLRAAGAVVQAVEAVMSGEHRRAFCAIRPPGHHAESSRAMGFCLFNSVAVGAAALLEANPEARVAIVDFDVHHGNGTQEIFRHHRRVLYASTHQSPLYPGTGHAHERSQGALHNHPLKPGSGSADFRNAWSALLDAMRAFSPDLVMVSAGFDAHRLDPLADLNVTTEDYLWLSERLSDVARETAQGRMVSALEGGYSLTALRDSVPAHIAALLEG